MSEKDFDQKVEMRRAFWALGASTRINVKLSALVTPTAKNRSGHEEWTDLDVLATEYIPLGGLVTSVADCRSTKGQATERVFWLRGVADLFGARTAFLVKDAALPTSTRQLALRLGVSAMDAADRAEFVRQAGTERLPQVGSFLNGDAVRRWEDVLLGTPKDIDRLQRYRRAFYWVFARGRNLVQLPAYLNEARTHMDVKQLWAQLLVLDLAWLYLLAVLHAIDEITRLHLTSLDSALRQVVVGSEQEIRDREALRQQIKLVMEMAEPDPRRRPPDLDIVPRYFSDLVDIAARLARRRTHATEALRILEFVGVETLANRGAKWRQAFPNTDSFAVKLGSDVVRFLCRATGLDTGFVDIFDAATNGAGDTKPNESVTPSRATAPDGGDGALAADEQLRQPGQGAPTTSGERTEVIGSFTTSTTMLGLPGLSEPARDAADETDGS